MAREDRFFDEIKIWSEIKLRIVEKYLEAYMNKRGRFNSVIYYVDGFAGAGYYGPDGMGRSEGSPIRAAKLAERISQTGKPNRLICLFVESKRNNYRQLCDALSQFSDAIAKPLFGSYRKQLPDILSMIGNRPAIFFLDPFGVKHITMSDMDPILGRRDTEVLVNFNTPRLRQLAGFEDSNAVGAEAKTALVSAVLGEDPNCEKPEWLQEWYRLNKNGVPWERWAADNYAKSLVGRSRELKYAMIYPVRERLDSNAKYYLIFATRSEHAIPFMNDFLCTEEDDLFTGIHYHGKNFQTTLFEAFKASERESRLKQLVDDIHAYGMQHQMCNREDIMLHFMILHFGMFKQRHYRDALDRLVEAKKARFSAGSKSTASISFM